MRIFRLAAVLALTAGPAAADPVTLREMSQYFNGFDTARAAFTQISPGGEIATGTLYMRRPGRARFEYDPPEETLVMAGGRQVAVFDGRSNSGRPEQYPLSRTPLSLILAPRVDLGRAGMLQGRIDEAATSTVALQDPRNPEYGHLELVFSDDPVQLRQWRVVDGAGEETVVVLGTMETDVDVGSRPFSIPLEIKERSGR